MNLQKHKPLIKRYPFFCSAVLLLGVLLFSCKKNTGEIKKPNPPQPPVSLAVVLKTADSTQVIDETLSGPKEATRLAQNMPASDFYTTGFYLPPGSEMKLELTAINGSRLPKLLVGTYSRYNSFWNPNTYNLVTGINSITDATGGILYFRFHNDSPDGKVQIKFVSGMRPMPFFQLGKTTQEDWVKMVDNITNVPDVQLVGKKTIITFSLANAKNNKTENQEALVKKADRVIAIEDSISGLFGNDPMDQPNVHKYLLTETDNADYYMAATHYRSFYSMPSGGASAIFKADNFTWGPWHELGHMHQQGSWTWSELGEVTVNIYSIAVEKAFGITPTRLTKDDEWSKAASYLARLDAERDFNGSNASVWIRLCMFQQLKLAFGDSFYHDLHRQARKETNRPNNTDSRMKWFILKASTISGKNLSGFFKKWGLKLSTTSATDALYADLDKLGLPNPSTDLTLLKD